MLEINRVSDSSNITTSSPLEAAGKDHAIMWCLPLLAASQSIRDGTPGVATAAASWPPAPAQRLLAGPGRGRG
jgi:hypothetical protein